MENQLNIFDDDGLNIDGEDERIDTKESER